MVRWVAIALCTTVVITPILSNYKINDLSKNYIAYDYGINTLNTLDNSTILFSAGDSATFVLMYLQMVEKLRQDLSIYDDTGVTFKNIYGERYLKMSIQEHQIQMNTIQATNIKCKSKICD